MTSITKESMTNTKLFGSKVSENLKNSIALNDLTKIEKSLNQIEQMKVEILNLDPNPIVIKKKSKEKLQYTQKIAVKYLKPPPLPPPGDLIIRQEADRIATPLSPIIIRQRMKTPPTPPPIILRERPPDAPKPIPQKIITIPGKVIPAKRPIILEKIESKSTKPQMIIIERWLPYPEQKRRVVYENINNNLEALNKNSKTGNKVKFSLFSNRNSFNFCFYFFSSSYHFKHRKSLSQIIFNF